ncbi:collagen-like triple helix repeat-containing protein [Vibrio fluvialis]|nr:collagen-like triple helix repeat-containing protein [Vibrio fluvialis]
MVNVYRTAIVTALAALAVAACSGNGSVASNNSGSSQDVTSKDVTTDTANTSSQSDKNLVSESGGVISQSQLTDTLDTITTGSGDVLVNLGEVVSALGDGLPLGTSSLEVDNSYVSTTLQGATKATTQLGTTVVSTGDAIAQLDALPVFVQLNNKTGLLTYTGETVSDLGGTVENVGQWLEYHTSEQGGLYGLTEGVSVMTAPILVQVGDMIDLKGHALVIVDKPQDLKSALPSLVYLSSTSLKQGTTALLMNANGTVENLGTVFVGEHGVTALLFNELNRDDTTLAAVKDQLSDKLSTSQLNDLNDLDLGSGGGLYTDVQGNLTLVTQRLGDVLSLDAGVIGSLDLNQSLLNLDSVSTSSTPLKSLLTSSAQSLTTIVGSLTGSTVNTLSLTKISDDVFTDSSVVASDSSEKTNLLNYLNTQVLSPLLGN